MPNLLNDNDINEIEVNFPIDGQRIQYLDYYQPKYISTGALFPKDSNILNNLKPSYVLPETIQLLGHWNDAGFIIKFYVQKTELNTLSLLQLHLTHIPTDNPNVGSVSNLSCMMYDFFAQVELRTGFGEASNKKYVIHLHRGFSRHCVKTNSSVKFFGDYFGNITVNNNSNFGIYEQSFNFGVNYSYKGKRTDNIYSNDKYEIENPNEIPPKKILDIFEKLDGPIVSNIKFTLKTSNQNYKPIKRITNDGQLPPNFTLVGERIYSDTLITDLTYIYDKNTSQLIRPDYTLRLYVKLKGEDGRVLDPNDAGKRKGYQKFSFNTLYWSRKGELIEGNFILSKTENIYIQNKNNLKIAPIRLTLNSSIANAGLSANQVSNFNNINLKFTIDGQYSSGFLEFSDRRNSTLGAKICHVKKIRIKSEAYFYDENYNTRKGELRFRLYAPLTDTEKFSNKLNYLTMVPDRFITLDFYNLDTFAYISQYSYKTDQSLLFREAQFQADTKNYRSFKTENNFRPKVYLRLYDNKEIFQNRQYNIVDFPQDGRMIFRGEALPAFIYNRLPELDLKNITSIRSFGEEPDNTTQTISLNAYRYIKYNLRLQSGNSSVPHRVTIWESSGLGVTSRYFDRTSQISTDSKTANYLDLMFPDWPGTKYDLQDDPYPRLSGELSELEKKNNPYYGCNRVIRIDIDTLSDISPTDFDCKAVVGDVNSASGIQSLVKIDRLRFNPPSDQDYNYKKLNTDNNEEGRRFLLMWHGHKPEEETDIIKNDSDIRYISTNEFVNRLNLLHSGLDCKAIDNIPITLTQGQHYRFSFPNKIRKQNLHTIDKFYENVNLIDIKKSDQNLIYYSEIFDGTYLDFPPFIQDFNNTDQEDSWKKSFKRRESNSSIHLDLRAYISLRGRVYGFNDFDNNDAIPRNPDIQRKISVTERINNISYFKDNTTNVESFELYKTGAIYPKYDILNSQFNRIGVIFKGESWDTPVKILSNKMTRVTFGKERPYKPNPYIVPLAYDFNYFTAAQSKIKNEVNIVLGKVSNSLNPYKNNAEKNIKNDGRMRIVKYNNSYLEAFNFKTSKLDNKILDIYGYSPQILNQNIEKNNTYYIFSETYKNQLNNKINPETLVFYNYSLDNNDSWIYYNERVYNIAKIFEHTENNSYCFSSNLNDIFSLGVYNNSLILQSTNFDLIKSSELQDSKVNSPLFSVLVDGNTLDNQEKLLFPELIDTSLSKISDSVSKWPCVVATDKQDVVCFYSLDSELNNVYFKILNYLNLSDRELLFSSSNLTKNSSFAISNLSIIFDQQKKLFRCLFLLSLNQAKIGLFYTEFDNNSSFISKPLIFHFIAGTFIEDDYKLQNIFLKKENNIIVNSGIEIPYQKPAMIVYENSNQKGLIGIFYVNNNGNLNVVNIIPFTSTSEQEKLQ